MLIKRGLGKIDTIIKTEDLTDQEKKEVKANIDFAKTEVKVAEVDVEKVGETNK